MCVLLFDVCKHFTIEKKRHSQNLSQKKKFRKENLKKCTIFEEQKGTRYIRGNVYFGILSSAVFRLQNYVSDFFYIIFFGR